MSDSPAVDKTIGNYVLLEKIGKGSLATVYRAVSHAGGEEVAIKILSPHFAHQDSYLERLQAQVTAVNNLNHPHIVPIHETGVHKGKVYLVMPLLAGGTLSDRLAQRGSLSASELTPMVTQVATALAAAHGVSVIHRDLKPSNILFDEAANAFVADFGLIQFVDTTVHASGLPGTLVYMSPEQFTGESLDGRSDQYSLAIILFEVLTGQLPFTGNMTELMFKQVHEPPPLSRLDNEPLAAVLGQALVKKAADRFETITAMATAWQQAVAAAQTGGPTEAITRTQALHRTDVTRDNEATFVVEPPPKRQPTKTPVVIDDAEATVIEQTADLDWPPPLDPDNTGPVIIPGAGGELASEPEKWWLLHHHRARLLLVILLVVLVGTGIAWHIGTRIPSEERFTTDTNGSLINVVNISSPATWQMGDDRGTVGSDSHLPWPTGDESLRFLTAAGSASLRLPGGMVIDIAPASALAFKLMNNGPDNEQLLVEIVEGRIVVSSDDTEAVIRTTLNSIASVQSGTMGVGYAEEPFLFEVDCFTGACKVADQDDPAVLSAGERTYLMGAIFAAAEPARHELYDFTTAVATATPTPLITSTPTATPTTAPTLTPTASPMASPTPSVTPTLTPTVTATPISRAAPRILQHTCADPGNFRSGNLITFAWTWDDQLRGNEYLEVRIGPRDGSAMSSMGAVTQQQGNQWSLAVNTDQFFNSDFYDYWWDVALVQPSGNVHFIIARSIRGCLRVEP